MTYKIEKASAAGNIPGFRPQKQFQIARCDIKEGMKLWLYPEQLPVLIVQVIMGGVMVQTPDKQLFNVDHTSLGTRGVKGYTSASRITAERDELDATMKAWLG